jgi:phosphatase NudJ
MAIGKSIMAAFFVLVVVRNGDRFLLIQEQQHDQTWYLPAGRVEPGEAFIAAARRETLEEAGIPIEIEGILRIEHSSTVFGGARIRVIFVARPADDTSLKSQPDEHSLQASWFTLAQLRTVTLRGSEVRAIFSYVAKGGPIYPLSLITYEGAPFL